VAGEKKAECVMKKTVLITIILIILVVGFAVYLGIVTELAIAFAFLSIAIATFFASRSLKLTNESLKLTRNTVRPFLSVQTGTARIQITSVAVTLNFEVKNTGVIPGELVSIDIAFFDSDEVVTRDNSSSRYPVLADVPAQPVVFPGAAYILKHTINISIDIGKQMWEETKNGNTKIRHRIKYKDVNNEYLTIQTEQLRRVSKNLLGRRPISPQYWT
jgi:hypothetical protein